MKRTDRQQEWLLVTPRLTPFTFDPIPDGSCEQRETATLRLQLDPGMFRHGIALQAADFYHEFVAFGFAIEVGPSEARILANRHLNTALVREHPVCRGFTKCRFLVNRKSLIPFPDSDLATGCPQELPIVLDQTFGCPPRAGQVRTGLRQRLHHTGTHCDSQCAGGGLFWKARLRNRNSMMFPS
jgi:hypothetical protein